MVNQNCDINFALDFGVGELSGSVDAPLREARLLLAFALNCTVSDIICKNPKISENDFLSFKSLVLRRKSGEPFAYLTGEKEFFGRVFFVEKGVLIPRPDTETLVEFALCQNSKKRLLDICSGSGCIAISVACQNKEISAIGVDISQTAVDLANKNAQKFGVGDRTCFLKGDILNDNVFNQNEKFDIIVSNPPYIKSGDIQSLETDVKDFEPHLALDGGNSGLVFYEKVCSIAPDILEKNGVLAFEIGAGQYEDVKNIMIENGFKNIGFKCDIANIKRVIFGEIDI